MAPKLHELLAVNQNLRGQSTACIADLVNTFAKKTTHFAAKRIVYKPVGEGQADQLEQDQERQTSVATELEWLSDKVSKALDCAHSIDYANCTAKADVVLDNGTTILTGVPATSLLQLEHRLAELQAFVVAIPTLDPAKGFKLDLDAGEGIFKAVDVIKPRTEKITTALVLYPHSDKHPAQVEKVVSDKTVGYTTTQEWSALITTAEKGRMLDRLENLTRAVKQARSRANDIEVPTQKIGERILGFVFNGK